MIAESGTNLLYFTPIFLIGLAIFLITRTMFQDEEQYKASEKLEEGSAGNKTKSNHGIVLKYSRPFFRRYVTPIISSMKNKKKIKEKYKQKLAAAGLTDYLSPEDFFAFKLFLILGFPITYLALNSFLELGWPMKYIPIVAFVGFFYPDIWVNGTIARRQEEVMRAMPFAVDMLALSVEAGLDFMAAMMKVVDKARPSALVEEFEILLKENKIGATRAEALRNLAWRIDLLPISSFCATLIAADSVGASIGPILKALSKEIREKKSSEVEKKGAQAATKLLFPMIAFVLPAVIIIVMGPIVMDFISGGGGP
jgi:tight adherence protein C